jgi:hypothetical protein
MSKKPISARVEENILKDSKAVAKLENRSFNNLRETALIAYCKGKLQVTETDMARCQQ